MEIVLVDALKHQKDFHFHFRLRDARLHVGGAPLRSEVLFG